MRTMPSSYDKHLEFFLRQFYKRLDNYSASLRLEYDGNGMAKSCS